MDVKYPREEMAQHVDAQQIERYFRALFGPFDVPEGASMMFAIRGVAEKGTPREGVFRESLQTGAMEIYIETLRRWARWDAGAFIVPAFLKEGSPNAPHDEHIHSFTSILCDIDRGDTVSALKHAEKHLGQCQLLVASGGTTETGHPKLHAYWLLSEPAGNVREVADARQLLAAKIGGDQSFQRLPQIVRIPGSVHLKGGKPSPVKIVMDRIDKIPRYDCAELIEKIWDMAPLPECQIQAEDAVRKINARRNVSAALPLNAETGAGLQFGTGSAATGEISGGVGLALVTPVHEGGVDGDRTRWSEFSKVAGHYIHCVRRGDMEIAEAKQALDGWVLANMRPPWPQQRIDSEWQAIVQKDIREKGALEGPKPAANAGLVITPPAQQTPQQTPEHEDGHGGHADHDWMPDSAIQDGKLHFEPPPRFILAPPDEAVIRQEPEHMLAGNPLMPWSVEHWTAPDQIPPRKWLVRGMLPAGKPSMLVAEGGAGKTYLCLELALKIATGSPADPQLWMGEKLEDDAYGIAMVITAEDDRDELAIRLAEIDPSGKRLNANGRLIVLPLINVGGAFPLVQTRRINRAGGITVEEHGPSEKWDQLLQIMAPLKGRLKLVVIDTFNSTSHGDENSATITQEYFRQATRVCGELGAALLVTHHFKKQGQGQNKVAIKTKRDAANAFRGSEAIKASVRQMITIWEPDDWKERLIAMGEKPAEGRIYRAAVTKANNREAFGGLKTLVRGDRGFLVDATDRDRFDHVQKSDEAAAWLVEAVRAAAEGRQPYVRTKSTSGRGLLNRRHELPPMIAKMGERTVIKLVDALLDRGALILCNDNSLDVPGGYWATLGDGKRERAGAWDPPQWLEYRFDPLSSRVVKAR